MDDRIFAFVKPWSMDFADDIFTWLRQPGQLIWRRDISSVPLEVIAQHYAHLQGEPYYEPMIRDIAGKRILIGVFAGDQGDYVQARDAIRETYDPYILPTDQHDRNSVHVSASPADFHREEGIWQGLLGFRTEYQKGRYVHVPTARFINHD